MQKTILITGATDGIGLETVKLLRSKDHHLLVHGRNQSKLDTITESLLALPGDGTVESYVAELSDLGAVDKMADSVLRQHQSLDVLINNAGIFKADKPMTDDGLDIRFVVNTLAPYRLTQRLLPLLESDGRVVNLSSAAQQTVDLQALNGSLTLDAMDAYAQSKLAITMWSIQMAKGSSSPVIIAVNPGSMLGSKMVREGFGVAGADLGIGADILARAALDEEFQSASGRYFDNDAGQFGSPHADAENPEKTAAVVRAIDSLVTRLTQQRAKT